MMSASTSSCDDGTITSGTNDDDTIVDISKERTTITTEAAAETEQKEEQQQKEEGEEEDLLIPILASDEVKVKETPLGQGGFCIVSAVHKFQFIAADTTTTTATGRNSIRQQFQKQFDNYYEKHYSYHNIRLPHQGPLAAHPSQQKPPKVALKRVKPSLCDEKYNTGMNDLINEILILSKCSHPNIITLYAVGNDDHNNESYNYCNNKSSSSMTMSKLIQSQHLNFAIIDQLKCTLKNKFYQWKNDSNNILLLQSKKQMYTSWLERLVVMMKVADAIRYLHEDHGILHRDIHPENIGFSYDNDVVKLFDFGLARLVTKNYRMKKVEYDDNELFNLTADTGTLRYMAPEVALSSPYGFKADVYSFGLVLHETLSLTKPFLRIQPNNFQSEVIIGGLRPTIDDTWPFAIRKLITRMWSNDIAMRPTSKEVGIILGELLRSGNDEDLFPKYWIDGWKKNLTSSMRSLKSNYSNKR